MIAPTERVSQVEGLFAPRAFGDLAQWPDTGRITFSEMSSSFATCSKCLLQVGNRQVQRFRVRCCLVPIAIGTRIVTSKDYTAAVEIVTAWRNSSAGRPEHTSVEALCYLDVFHGDQNSKEVRHAMTSAR